MRVFLRFFFFLSEVVSLSDNNIDDADFTTLEYLPNGMNCEDYRNLNLKSNTDTNSFTNAVTVRYLAAQSSINGRYLGVRNEKPSPNNADNHSNTRKLSVFRRYTELDKSQDQLHSLQKLHDQIHKNKKFDDENPSYHQILHKKLLVQNSDPDLVVSQAVSGGVDVSRAVSGGVDTHDLNYESKQNPVAEKLEAKQNPAAEKNPVETSDVKSTTNAAINKKSDAYDVKTKVHHVQKYYPYCLAHDGQENEPVSEDVLDLKNEIHGPYESNQMLVKSEESLSEEHRDASAVSGPKKDFEGFIAWNEPFTVFKRRLRRLNEGPISRKLSNFRGSNLKNANLRGVYMPGADFSGADLTNADFSGATFHNGYNQYQHPVGGYAATGNTGYNQHQHPVGGYAATGNTGYYFNPMNPLQMRNPNLTNSNLPTKSLSTSTSNSINSVSKGLLSLQYADEFADTILLNSRYCLRGPVVVNGTLFELYTGLTQVPYGGKTAEETQYNSYNNGEKLYSINGYEKNKIEESGTGNNNFASNSSSNSDYIWTNDDDIGKIVRKSLSNAPETESKWQELSGTATSNEGIQYVREVRVPSQPPVSSLRDRSISSFESGMYSAMLATEGRKGLNAVNVKVVRRRSLREKLSRRGELLGFSRSNDLEKERITKDSKEVAVPQSIQSRNLQQLQGPPISNTPRYELRYKFNVPGFGSSPIQLPIGKTSPLKTINVHLAWPQNFIFKEANVAYKFYKPSPECAIKFDANFTYLFIPEVPFTVPPGNVIPIQPIQVSIARLYLNNEQAASSEIQVTYNPFYFSSVTDANGTVTNQWIFTPGLQAAGSGTVGGLQERALRMEYCRERLRERRELKGAEGERKVSRQMRKLGRKSKSSKKVLGKVEKKLETSRRLQKMPAVVFAGGKTNYTAGIPNHPSSFQEVIALKAGLIEANRIEKLRKASLLAFAVEEAGTALVRRSVGLINYVNNELTFPEIRNDIDLIKKLPYPAGIARSSKSIGEEIVKIANDCCSKNILENNIFENKLLENRGETAVGLEEDVILNTVKLPIFRPLTDGAPAGTVGEVFPIGVKPEQASISKTTHDTAMAVIRKMNRRLQEDVEGAHRKLENRLERYMVQGNLDSEVISDGEEQSLNRNFRILQEGGDVTTNIITKKIPTATIRNSILEKTLQSLKDIKSVKDSNESKNLGHLDSKSHDFIQGYYNKLGDIAGSAAVLAVEGVEAVSLARQSILEYLKQYQDELAEDGLWFTDRPDRIIYNGPVDFTGAVTTRGGIKGTVKFFNESKGYGFRNLRKLKEIMNLAKVSNKKSTSSNMSRKLQESNSDADANPFATAGDIWFPNDYSSRNKQSVPDKGILPISEDKVTNVVKYEFLSAEPNGETNSKPRVSNKYQWIEAPPQSSCPDCLLRITRKGKTNANEKSELEYSFVPVGSSYETESGIASSWMWIPSGNPGETLELKNTGDKIIRTDGLRKNTITSTEAKEKLCSNTGRRRNLMESKETKVGKTFAFEHGSDSKKANPFSAPKRKLPHYTTWNGLKLTNIWAYKLTIPRGGTNLRNALALNPFYPSDENKSGDGSSTYYNKDNLETPEETEFSLYSIKIKGIDKLKGPKASKSESESRTVSAEGDVHAALQFLSSMPPILTADPVQLQDDDASIYDGGVSVEVDKFYEKIEIRWIGLIPPNIIASKKFKLPGWFFPELGKIEITDRDSTQTQGDSGGPIVVKQYRSNGTVKFFNNSKGYGLRKLQESNNAVTTGNVDASATKSIQDSTSEFYLSGTGNAFLPWHRGYLVDIDINPFPGINNIEDWISSNGGYGFLPWHREFIYRQIENQEELLENSENIESLRQAFKVGTELSKKLNPSDTDINSDNSIKSNFYRDYILTIRMRQDVFITFPSGELDSEEDSSYDGDYITEGGHIISGFPTRIEHVTAPARKYKGLDSDGMKFMKTLSYIDCNSESSATNDPSNKLPLFLNSISSVSPPLMTTGGGYGILGNTNDILGATNTDNEVTPGLIKPKIAIFKTRNESNSNDNLKTFKMNNRIRSKSVVENSNLRGKSIFDIIKDAKGNYSNGTVKFFNNSKGFRRRKLSQQTEYWDTSKESVLNWGKNGVPGWYENEEFLPINPNTLLIHIGAKGKNNIYFPSESDSSDTVTRKPTSFLGSSLIPTNTGSNTQIGPILIGKKSKSSELYRISTKKEDLGTLYKYIPVPPEEGLIYQFPSTPPGIEFIKTTFGITERWLVPIPESLPANESSEISDKNISIWIIPPPREIQKCIEGEGILGNGLCKKNIRLAAPDTGRETENFQGNTILKGDISTTKQENTREIAIYAEKIKLLETNLYDFIGEKNHSMNFSTRRLSENITSNRKSSYRRKLLENSINSYGLDTSFDRLDNSIIRNLDSSNNIVNSNIVSSRRELSASSFFNSIFGFLGYGFNYFAPADENIGLQLVDNHGLDKRPIIYLKQKDFETEVIISDVRYIINTPVHIFSLSLFGIDSYRNDVDVSHLGDNTIFKLQENIVFKTHKITNKLLDNFKRIKSYFYGGPLSNAITNHTEHNFEQKDFDDYDIVNEFTFDEVIYLDCQNCIFDLNGYNIDVIYNSNAFTNTTTFEKKLKETNQSSSEKTSSNPNPSSSESKISTKYDIPTDMMTDGPSICSKYSDMKNIYDIMNFAFIRIGKIAKDLELRGNQGNLIFKDNTFMNNMYSYREYGDNKERGRRIENHHDMRKYYGILYEGFTTTVTSASTSATNGNKSGSTDVIQEEHSTNSTILMSGFNCTGLMNSCIKIHSLIPEVIDYVTIIIKDITSIKTGIQIYTVASNKLNIILERVEVKHYYKIVRDYIDEKDWYMKMNKKSSIEANCIKDINSITAFDFSVITEDHLSDSRLTKDSKNNYHIHCIECSVDGLGFFTYSDIDFLFYYLTVKPHLSLPDPLKHMLHILPHQIPHQNIDHIMEVIDDESITDVKKHKSLVHDYYYMLNRDEDSSKDKVTVPHSVILNLNIRGFLISEKGVKLEKSKINLTNSKSIQLTAAKNNFFNDYNYIIQHNYGVDVIKNSNTNDLNHNLLTLLGIKSGTSTTTLRDSDELLKHSENSILSNYYKNIMKTHHFYINRRTSDGKYIIPKSYIDFNPVDLSNYDGCGIRVSGNTITVKNLKNKTLITRQNIKQIDDLSSSKNDINIVSESDSDKVLDSKTKSRRKLLGKLGASDAPNLPNNLRLASVSLVNGPSGILKNGKIEKCLSSQEIVSLGTLEIKLRYRP